MLPKDLRQMIIYVNSNGKPLEKKSKRTLTIKAYTLWIHLGISKKTDWGKTKMIPGLLVQEASKCWISTIY